jgi:hypothetical protein
MTRAVLTKTTLKGPFPTLPVTADSLDVTFTAANAANKEEFLPSGNDIVLAWNTDGATPYTFTISSVADPQLRTGDIGPYTLAAGEIAAFKLKSLGFTQTDGYIYLEASNAAIKFAVIADN